MTTTPGSVDATDGSAWLTLAGKVIARKHAGRRGALSSPQCEKRGAERRRLALDAVRHGPYCPSFRMPHALAHPISLVVAVVDRAAARKRLR
jgi:hypothetical protein